MSQSASSLEMLTNASGIGPSTLEEFKEAGFESPEEVGSNTPEELSDKVNRVGYSTAISVLKYLEEQGLRDVSKRDADLEQLVELLQDLFEFDNQDYDFGVYKLMNANREEIETYIEEDLVGKIETEVSELYDEFGSGVSRKDAKDEVINELGGEALEDGELTSEAEQKIEQKTEGVSDRELENIRSDIYNHIYKFFSNYYESGDFITRRQRSHHSEPYSVPYDGSNTHFHWVTKDQYYAKTSDVHDHFKFEHYDDFSFVFNLVDEEFYNTDEDSDSDEEYWIMEDPSEFDVDRESKTITIEFCRQTVDDEELLNRCGVEQNNKNSFKNTFKEEICTFLSEKDISFDEEEIKSRTEEYLTKNQNDFFIHKNIEGFLTNELEEYVKSNIFVANPDMKKQLGDLSFAKGQIVREVGDDIISFVSQIEEFKRKLFEKKKFVKKSKKLTQVDKIPNENYEKLLDNQNQMISWENYYDINRDGLSTDNFEESPYNQMLVDTSHFDQDITTGQEPQNKLIKGDNYQALNFLQDKYEESVKCVYIDPPYNTHGDFAYKDSYQRPTWLSLMRDRIELAKPLLEDNGIVFVSIDENEVNNLKRIMNEIFGEENHITTIAVENTKTQGMKVGAAKDGSIVKNYEYVLCYSKNVETGTIVENLLYDKKEGYDTHYSTVLLEENNSNGYISYKLGEYILNIDENEKIITLFEQLGLLENGKLSIEDIKTGILKSNEIKNYIYKELGSKIYRIMPADINIDDSVKNKLEVGKAQKYKDYILVKKSSGTISQYHCLDDSLGYDDGYNKEYGRRTIRGNLWKGFYSDMMNVSKEGGVELKNGKKPVRMIKQLIYWVIEEGDTVLDFFAGSGTTAQAVYELNDEEEMNINFLLVELLDSSYDLIEKRLRHISTEYDSATQVECIELESYEESLDAVEFDEDQETLGSYNETLLNYLLEFGTKDSPVFLDSDQLSNPLDYELDGSVESEPVDVMTTFNYLIGLDNYTKETHTIEDVEYTIFSGSVEDNKVKIIWRHDAEKADYETENEEINTSGYDKVYTNGDSAIKQSTPISKVFAQKMLNTR